jgi:hypothetical protein
MIISILIKIAHKFEENGKEAQDPDDGKTESSHVTKVQKSTYGHSVYTELRIQVRVMI